MTALYHDCTNEVATWAVGQLRPQFSAWYTELDPLVERAAVPTRFILCRDDRVLDPSWARRAAKLKLGVEAVEMPGGHCPMLARPAQLVTMLLSLS